MQGTIKDKLTQLAYNLREQPEYPNIRVDGVLFFYDVCCALGMRERDIYDLLGPRGYLYIAKTTHFAPSEEALDVFDDAITELHKRRWRDGKQTNLG